MDQLKLSQIGFSELKIDYAMDFALNSCDNHQTLIGNYSDIFIMDMVNSCNTAVNFPYKIAQIAVPQERPFVKLLKAVDLVHIYGNCNVLENQELALDPIYVTECLVEPPKAKMLHVEILPSCSDEEEEATICCILTNYGHCTLYKKCSIVGNWLPLNVNIMEILNDIYPIDPTAKKLKTFQDLKDYVNKFLITAFSWSNGNSKHNARILYLATAAGYVLALKFDKELLKFSKYFEFKTSLDYITYIRNCNELLVIGSSFGQVALFKIVENNNSSTLKELDYLWSRKDRITCRKVVLSLSEELNSYLLAFSKGAHLLVYRVDKLNSNIIARNTLHLSGIKITGIEFMSPTQLIITTIMSQVKYIQISCPSSEEINLYKKLIQTPDIDSKNYQILGLGSSRTGTLWSILLYRNKEYANRSKFSTTSAFISTCKLSNCEALAKLDATTVIHMNAVKDYLLVINLDILNNQDADKYNDYTNLIKLKLPTSLNQTYMQKLQIKLFILKHKAIYQGIKYKYTQKQTLLEIEFCENAIKLIHIVLRLCHLQRLSEMQAQLTDFQKLAVACMQAQFNCIMSNYFTKSKETAVLVANARDLDKDDADILTDSTDRYAKVLAEDFQRCKFNIESLNIAAEQCNFCGQEININQFEKCTQGHAIKRCSISFVQLPLFQQKYCPQCSALAINDAVTTMNLKELFAENECVKCTLCGFLLKNDERF